MLNLAKKWSLIMFIILLAGCTPQPVAPTPSPSPIPTAPAGANRPELRAFWVDAFHPGIKSPQEVDKLLQDMQAAKANAVIVQVRRRADAYYNQTLEPRSDELRKLPDYDPLAYLIQQAHAANPPIEVHAWLVAMPLGRPGETPTSPEHLYFKHGPTATGEAMWLSSAASGSLASEGNYFLDPGHPAAAQYFVEVVLNLVRHYDVDGIHLDYIRYSGAQWGYNPASVARYRQSSGATGTPAPADPAWQQWRREQVTHLMRQIYLETIALKPAIKVSAATIAWGAGPTSAAAWQKSPTMSETFQDWLGWLQEGILDVAFPMNYDRETNEQQKQWFDQWLEWEKSQRGERHLVIGLGAYINTIEGSLAQARRALAPSASGQTAQGVCFFAYADSEVHGLSPERFFRALTTAEPPETEPLFGAPVRPPEMPWKTRPTTGYLKGLARYADGQPADGLTVTLRGPAPRTLTVSGTGFYGAAGLPPGDYTLTVTSAGQTLASTTARIQAGQVTTVDVTL